MGSALKMFQNACISPRQCIRPLLFGWIYNANRLSWLEFVAHYRVINFPLQYFETCIFSRKDANVLDSIANGEPVPASLSFILNTCRLLDLGKAFKIFERISSSIGNGFRCAPSSWNINVPPEEKWMANSERSGTSASKVVQYPSFFFRFFLAYLLDKKI